MLLRLIIAIVLAVVAVPGMASACHDSTPRMTMRHHGTHHMPGKSGDVATVHACIGCIPPSSWRVATVDRASIVPPLPRAIVIDAFLAGRAAPPALPPPRMG